MNYFISCLIILLSCSIGNATVGFKAKVSLRDKIGQMIILGFDGKTVNSRSPIAAIIEKNNIGGVILFDYDYHTKTYNRNIENPLQVKQLNHDLQYLNYRSNLKHHRQQLPLLISVDYEGGKVTRLSQHYGFPVTISAAAVGKLGLQQAESTAKTMTQTLKNTGFNLDFAPVLDVNVNPDNPIIGKEERSFSNDPDKVVSYARVYSRHFLQQNIQCVYKHFPGHGSSTGDSHLGFVDVTDSWQSYELEPYHQLLNSDHACGMVMSAHIVNRQLDESGLPATLSHKIITDVLRHQLHFRGVVVTDDMQMKAISAHYGLERALVLAINAGADMVIFGNNLSDKSQDPKQLIDIIEANVLLGYISLERIDNAYQHIIELKQTLRKVPLD